MALVMDPKGYDILRIFFVFTKSSEFPEFRSCIYLLRVVFIVEVNVFFENNIFIK